MNYHIEGEVVRVTLNGEGGGSVRISPTPDFVRKDGDMEKALLVGESIDAPIRCARKEEFEKTDIEFSEIEAFLPLFLSCKANRGRIRVEVEDEAKEVGNKEKKNGKFMFNNKEYEIKEVSVI